MRRWVSHHPIMRPTWPLPVEPIHRILTKAYYAQSKIGWDQFFVVVSPFNGKMLLLYTTKTGVLVRCLHLTNGCE
jgi:hypothetical protein